MRRTVALSSIVLCAFAGAASGGAPEGFKLLQEGKVAEAKAELERGVAQGDAASQGLLAFFHWNGFDGKVDRSAACRLAVPAAAGRDATGQSVLARCHLDGIEVEKDLLKARELARSSAAAGNNEGRVVFYLAVVFDPALSFMVDGKANQKKYDALAARPVEERSLEIEAVDMLARAAEAGHRDAALLLAGYFFNTIGNGNRSKARQIFSKIPNLPAEAVRYRDALAKADEVAAGSAATVKLLADAQFTGLMATTMKLWPPGPGAPRPDCKDIRMKSAKVAVSLQNGVFLPHTHRFVQNSYLMKGHWEEDWTYEACGRSAVVRIQFDADGFAGARHTNVQRPFGGDK